MPTHKSSVHPRLGNTPCAPCTSDSLSSSNCSTSKLSLIPAKGCSFAGSYAEVKRSEAVGVYVGAEGAGTALILSLWAGPDGGWAVDVKVAELNSSLEEEGSSGVGLLEPNSPLKKDMLAGREIESSC